MPPKANRIFARVFVPLAILAAGVALFVIVSGSGDEQATPSDSAETTAPPTDTGATTTPTKPKRPRATYTVKPGDSLGSIAVKTDTEVETLELLNPEVDPQALSVGQKIKLRE